MHHFRDEPGGRRSIAPSRKLWTALQVLNDYLTSQSGEISPNVGDGLKDQAAAVWD
jgi:hypothetical protein